MKILITQNVRGAHHIQVAYFPWTRIRMLALTMAIGKITSSAFQIKHHAKQFALHKPYNITMSMGKLHERVNLLWFQIFCNYDYTQIDSKR